VTAAARGVDMVEEDKPTPRAVFENITSVYQPNKAMVN
jgi:hypothetical protein